MHQSRPILSGLFTLSLAAVALNSIELAGSIAKAEPVASPARTIFVSDFELDAASGQEGAPNAGLGILPRGGLVSTLRQGLAQGPTDPQAGAAALVNRIADALVAELSKSGFASRRLRHGEPYPPAGWLVRGIFTEMDTGNRLRRAVIGFGVGGTEMQLQIVVSDLAKHPNEAFYSFGVGTSSDKGPGAVLFRNPYVALAKFVLSTNAPERDIDKTARQIADEIAKHAAALPP
ncbi:DUF4410 domain-containing protein [Inquilinus sp. CA228]|uniref:DUF4410 domain-containing protein n=1 Tax=Inquilinus sp. CA228 TaxID=3455609 RepID=UPI003F8D198A